MSLRDRVLLLRSVENFEGLDDDGLILLAEHATNRLYRKGEVISEKGAAPRTVVFVVDGQVTVERPGRADNVIRRGFGFGMYAIMADVASDRAVADVDTITLEIPVAAFRVAVEENFSLLRNSLRIMGGALALARGRLPASPDDPPSLDMGDYYEHPRTLVELLIYLRRGLFGQMNIDALVDLTRRMTEVRVPAGHVFWAAGESCSYSVHVDYGRVRCTSADGRYIDVGSNFTLGVMDTWSTLPRSYEARAETDVIAYRIEYEDFIVICEMHVSVGLEMLRGIARQYLVIERGQS